MTTASLHGIPDVQKHRSMEIASVTGVSSLTSFLRFLHRLAFNVPQEKTDSLLHHIQNCAVRCTARCLIQALQNFDIAFQGGIRD